MMKNKILRLREKEILYPTVLSPMAGVTDVPFRRLCRTLSGNRLGLFVSEFVSTDGCAGEALKKRKELIFGAGERPFGIQIFGKHPERMAEGARVIEELAPDFIEINAGCPAPKVAGKGGGAGLLKDLPRLASIIREVRRAIRIPLTLKCRTGWDETNINVLETLKIAENEGVELLTVHGRTRVQGYYGLADWEVIGAVAESARIPVIGNGDIISAEMALDRLERYPVSGVSIGRGALHNPWLFGQIADALEGHAPREIPLEEVLGIFPKYYEDMLESGATSPGALGRLKQLAARLCKGITPENPEFRRHLLSSAGAEIFLERLETVREELRGFHFSPDHLVNLNGKNEDELQFGSQFKK
ncbi:MAG: tRNA-dihydrouridine synthase [Fibrobacter sp.]|nr:tRNA-dihydrouridine synthase [Fibrobacter sp.]